MSLQISVPSASAAQMAGPSLLAAQQQLAALNPAPGPSSFPAAASLLMMAPTTQPSRTPSLLHSPLPPQGRIGRGALQAHGTPGHGNSHAVRVMVGMHASVSSMCFKQHRLAACVHSCFTHHSVFKDGD